MKSVFFRFLILAALLMVVIPVSADKGKENPSVYSFAEIVQALPEKWTANPVEIMEMMKEYPDFVCYRSHDIIGCTSVNNKYASEVHVNYQFTSEDDNSEFVQAVFSMKIDSSEEVQKIMEAFWLNDMRSANITGAYFPNDQIILYFSAGDTMMTVTIPMKEDGSLWMIMVDFGLIRG